MITVDLTKWAIDVPIPKHPKIGELRIRFVLIVLVQYANRQGVAWPSTDTIAGRVGCTRWDVSLILSHLADAEVIAAEGERRRGRTTRWRFPLNLSGNPDKSVVENSADLSENLPGKLSGNLSGFPDTNQNQNQNLPPTPRNAGEGGRELSPSPAHEHEPFAVRGLTRIIRERDLPTTLERALSHAYQLGDGDPFRGYEVIRDATERDFRTGAFDPERVYLSRIGIPRAS